MDPITTASLTIIIFALIGLIIQKYLSAFIKKKILVYSIDRFMLAVARKEIGMPKHSAYNLATELIENYMLEKEAEERTYAKGTKK